MWFTCFTVFSVHKDYFHVLNNVSQTFIELFCKFFDRHKEYNSCLISFLSFSELFPAFNWDKEIGNLLSIWLGVRICKPFNWDKEIGNLLSIWLGVKICKPFADCLF